MTRKELKALIKECLVEVLNEGLGGSLSTSGSNVRGVTEGRQQSAQRTRKFDPRLDSPVATRQQAPAIQHAIAAEAGGNKLMQSILADTANTTLQEMMSAERGQSSTATTHYERLVENTDPDELFGEETAGKWAELAFANIPRSNRQQDF